MAIELSKDFYQGRTDENGNSAVRIKTNADKVFADISNMIRDIKDGAENLSEWCAREITEDARQNLKDSGYNVDGLLYNIQWGQQRSKQYYTVSLKDNSDKDKMYYLEYGTGFVGAKNPHEEASKVGWDYAINEGAKWYFDTDDLTTIRGRFYPTGTNSLGEKVKNKGWYYYDENGGLNLTSGLKAVSYMYNAYRNFDKPNGAYERALEKSKMKSILKVRK